MKRFGPFESGLEEVDTPIGTPCARCGDPMKKGDSGVVIPHLGPIHRLPNESADDYIVRAAESVIEEPWHLSCVIEAIMGKKWMGSFPRKR